MVISCTIKLENWVSEKLYKNSKLISSTEIKLTIYEDFTENNDYPLKVVNHIIYQELSQVLEVKAVEIKNYDTEKKVQLFIPYSGKQGHQLLLKMKKQLKET